LFQFGEKRNCTIFIKFGTKLRQKLKYRDQIENEKMTSGIIVTRDTVTVTWHCHGHVTRCQLDTWQICNSFKKI